MDGSFTNIKNGDPKDECLKESLEDTTIDRVKIPLQYFCKKQLFRVFVKNANLRIGAKLIQLY